MQRIEETFFFINKKKEKENNKLVTESELIESCVTITKSFDFTRFLIPSLYDYYVYYNYYYYCIIILKS